MVLVSLNDSLEPFAVVHSAFPQGNLDGGF